MRIVHEASCLRAHDIDRDSCVSMVFTEVMTTNLFECTSSPLCAADYHVVCETWLHVRPTTILAVGVQHR